MKYFAYGSNMNSKRMEEKRVPFLKRRSAKLRGYKLKFNKIATRKTNEGYANIVADLNSIVEGVLYDVLESGLNRLNGYEGVPDGHYKRMQVTVQLHNGEEVEAITYIANPDKVKEKLKPRKKYLSHLLASKDILSEAYYKELEKTETLD